MCLGGLEHVFGRSRTCVWEVLNMSLGGLEHVFGRSKTCVWEV